MLNRVQSANRNEQQNRKTEVFWQKTDLKAAKTAKPKIPMPPSRLPSSMAALHNTPRYSRESDYMEPFWAKKTFKWAYAQLCQADFILACHVYFLSPIHDP